MRNARPHRPRRRRLVLLVALELLVIAIGAELGLRALEGRHAGLRRLLYMPGVAPDYQKCSSLAELLARAPVPQIPCSPHGDWYLSSKGFKTAEYDEAKADGTWRCVVLGDSFTFSAGGVPYRDLLHSRIELTLEEQLGRDVEAINLGQPAVGTDFELRLWQLEGARLDADLVVLAFFVGNDFSDIGGTSADRSRLDRLARRSSLVRLARNLFVRATHGPQAPSPRRELAPAEPGGGCGVPRPVTYPPTRRPTFDEAQFDEIEIRRMSLCDVDRTDSFEAAFTRAADLLRELRDAVAASGAELVVLLIPDQFQVDDELRSRLIEVQGRSADEFDVERPQRRLRELCESAGIACVDPLSEFRARGRDEPLYLPRDTHWNEAGIRIAADLVCADVLASGIAD